MSVTVAVDLVELFIMAVEQQLGASEVPPASNAGPYVETVLAAVGLAKGNPWCAAMIARSGRLALDAVGLRWPLPMTGGCQNLADYLAAKGALHELPQRGDLWLRWEQKLGRFGHVGVVRSVPNAAHIEVQAGNTIRPGSAGDVREGWLNWIRTEAVGERDRFGRWVDLVSVTKLLPVVGAPIAQTSPA